jgi:hypothetical protein
LLSGAAHGFELFSALLLFMSLLLYASFLVTNLFRERLFTGFSFRLQASLFFGLKSYGLINQPAPPR